MSQRQHRIRLTPDERTKLLSRTRTGHASALEQQHARMLLLADEAQPGRRRTDAAVAEAVGVSARTVARIREQFATEGLEACLHRRPTTRVYTRRLDDSQQRRLVALAQSTPPAGHAAWTLTLLADHLVLLEITDHICPETVRTTLKKTGSSRTAAPVG